MRFTIVAYTKSGETFALYDSWENTNDAHASLRNQWRGITMCFARDCEDIGGCIENICAMYDNQDVHMQTRKELTFDESHNSYFDIQPYSECYDPHPHFLLPTKSGWKRTPARADPFTGKSSAVMKERRKSARRSLRPKTAHATRLRLLTETNQALLREQRDNMDVDTSGLSDVAGDHFNSNNDFTKSENTYNTDLTDIPVPMVVDTILEPRNSDLIIANHTKPNVPAKYKQRMGAKKATNIELSSDSGHTLSQTNDTLYRALAARCHYMSQDRPDLAFSSKEICREFSVPTMTSLKKLERLVRYLAGMPQLVYHYKFQDMPSCVDFYIDTDFAGCRKTRRSTSGRVAMLGGCCVKHSAKT